MRYRISGANLDPAWKNGRTLNISVSGMLIEIPEAVPVGAELELSIEWLRLYHGRPTVLLVIGTVIRNDEHGTALRILCHEFRCALAAAIPSRSAEKSLAVA